MTCYAVAIGRWTWMRLLFLCNMSTFPAKHQRASHNFAPTSVLHTRFYVIYLS